MAVNTEDGSALWDFAFSLLLSGMGNPVDQSNEALALASCTECITGAVAFQIILIIGQADEITPTNGALALNYECATCATFAFAYQIIATLSEPPSPELQTALALVMQRLSELEAGAGSLTVAEILLVLDQIEDDTLAALDESLAVENAASAGSLTDEATSAEVDGTGESETPEPATPTDSATGSEASSESTASEPPASEEPAGETAESEPTPEGETTEPAPCAETEETPAADCSEDPAATDGATGE